MLGDEGIGNASPVGDGREHPVGWTTPANPEREQEIEKEAREARKNARMHILEYNPPLDQGSASPGVKKTAESCSEKTAREDILAF